VCWGLVERYYRKVMLGRGWDGRSGVGDSAGFGEAVRPVWIYA
jgi:hypothetical protein